MTQKEIENGINACHGAMDIISNLSENGDDSGITQETHTQIYELMEVLKKESEKNYKKRLSVKVNNLLKNKLNA